MGKTTFAVMVLPGHLAGGYLTTAALLALVHPALSAGQLTALYVVGTLAGELPDIDIAVLLLELLFKKSPLKESHREYITHTAFFWLSISAVIAIIGFWAGSLFIVYSALVLLGGAWSHLLLDSIEYGVMWLWPFSYKRFSMIKKVPEENITARTGTVKYYIDFILGPYLKTKTLWLEILITLSALILFMLHFS